MAARRDGSTGDAWAFAESHGFLLGTYAAAIFLSAALLFSVQPLFAKMVLPRLGGSPQVWSVAMVFFQAALLAGYAYAHLLTSHLPGRLSVIVHVALMIVATFALPLAIAGGWGRPPAQGEALWLLGLFAVSIGLPFFALSANGPLLQAWFARTGHPAAGDPYFLYAASNVGSFLALISYPFLIEPFTRLGDQTRMWSAGFFTLIVLIAGCGVLLMRSRNALPDIEPAPPRRADAPVEAVPGERAAPRPDAPPSWRDAATWVALAAIPSGLLIAVTAHVSTDVAASPLLWVIPLALYLLTFVIVFQSKPLLPHRYVVMVEPAFIIGLVAVLVYSGLDYILLTIAANIVAFFVIALTCHGELARRRPSARHLTAFYMWMSTGGMIGGIAAGLIAPHIFSLGRRVPDPDRARDSVPARPQARAGEVAAVRVGGARAACARRLRRRPCSRLPARRQAVQDRDRGAAGDLARVLARPAEIRRDDRARLHRGAVVRARRGRARLRAQLLRRAQDHRDHRRPVPHPDARDDRARCATHPQRRRRADRRPARAAHLLPRQLADRARHQGGARAQERPDPPGDRRTGDRQAPRA